MSASVAAVSSINMISPADGALTTKPTTTTIPELISKKSLPLPTPPPPSPPPPPPPTPLSSNARRNLAVQLQRAAAAEPTPAPPYKVIDFCVLPIERSGGILTHHYMRIDGNDVHLGRYSMSKIQPTKNGKRATCYQHQVLCVDCYRALVDWVNSFNDVVIFNWLFPIVNCETLVRGHSTQFNICLVAGVCVIASYFLNMATFIGPICVCAAFALYIYNINLRTSKPIVTRCPHVVRD